MKISWFGTASVLIETEKTALLFDPYMKDLPKGRESEEIRLSRKQAFEKQKNVLVTHGHFDHIASITPIFSNLPCKVYVTKMPYNTLKKRKFPLEKMQEIRVGDELRFDDVCARVIKGKHVKFLRRDILRETFKLKSLRYFIRRTRLSFDFLKYPEKGETVMYELTAENKKILVMGSAGIDYDVEYPTGVDLLILPHQGRSDIDQVNKKVVEKLQPKRVLLTHYDDAFPPISSDVPVDGFCADMSRKIPTEKLVEGVSIEI